MTNIYDILSRDPQVKPAMLTANFWIEHDPHSAQRPLALDIDAYNRSVYQRLGLPPVLAAPEAYTRAELVALIEAAAPRREAYLQADGTAIAPKKHPAWQNAVGALAEHHPARFALALGWTPLRSLPTWEIFLDEPYDFPTDYLQETSIDVGWPVAIYATSHDGAWVFGLTPLYWGWLPTESLAWATREAVAAWQARATVTVLSSRALVGVTGRRSVTPQMGTSLPLLGQTATAYRVAIPGKNTAGELVEQVGWASRLPSPVSQVGPALSPNPAALVTSAFELLGERYAWGDSRLGQFGRDCSRLVKDIYATIGIVLARNADEQELTLPPAPIQDLQQMQLGDLLFIPGHVMFCLGVVEGIPYLLHAFGRQYKAVVVTSSAPPQAEHLLNTQWTLCRLGSL